MAYKEEAREKVGRGRDEDAEMGFWCYQRGQDKE